MNSFAEFIEMGGHAGFIWPSYGIVTVVLVGLFIAGVRFHKRSEAELNRLNPRARRNETDSDNLQNEAQK